MAVKKPLALYNGDCKELQSGDTLASNTSYVVKSADQTITSQTTIQNDTHLSHAVESNSNYDIELVLFFNPQSVNQQIKCGFSAPSGSSGYWGATDNPQSLIGLFNNTGVSGNPQLVGTAGVATVVLKGLLVVAGTAGTLQFKWAQNSSSATGLILKANSFIRITKL